MFLNRAKFCLPALRWAPAIITVALSLLMARSLWRWDTIGGFVPGLGAVAVMSGGAGIMVICYPPESDPYRGAVLRSEPWKVGFECTRWDALLPSRSGMGSTSFGHAWMGGSKYDHCPDFLKRHGCELYWIYFPAGHEENAVLDRRPGHFKVGPRDWSGGYDAYARFPQWLMLIPSITIAALFWRRRWKQGRQAKRAASGLCPKCGYDLRVQKSGLAGDKCPECGTPIPAPPGFASRSPPAKEV